MRAPTCLHDSVRRSKPGENALNFAVFHKSRRKLNGAGKFSQAAQSPFSFLSLLHRGVELLCPVSQLLSLCLILTLIGPRTSRL